MTTMRSVRVLVSVVAISAGAATSGLMGAATANAAKVQPVLKVTPAAGLTNGKTVTVSGTGFKAHDSVYIVECLAKAKGGGQCNVAGAIPATINAKGILPPTKFKVVAGKIATGKCGTTTANLKSCALSAGNATGGDSASALIVFKAAKK